MYARYGPDFNYYDTRVQSLSYILSIVVKILIHGRGLDSTFWVDVSPSLPLICVGVMAHFHGTIHGTEHIGLPFTCTVINCSTAKLQAGGIYVPWPSKSVEGKKRQPSQKGPLVLIASHPHMKLARLIAPRPLEMPPKSTVTPFKSLRRYLKMTDERQSGQWDHFIGVSRQEVDQWQAKRP
ncbi:hypothetical protein FGADI_5720 [Fusarium gaditjirri]|uniref:Uncharacterized protein n=1 Tax=Fusarium gaditjirri TaxID=282569 RepID=A0A8H4WX00_9HYPO|nr:hypothetical protein FGADI_5720 [Fusarium gaditjirri]